MIVQLQDFGPRLSAVRSAGALSNEARNAQTKKEPLDKKDLYNAAAGSGESRHQVNSLLGMDWGDDRGDEDEVDGDGKRKQTTRPASQMAQRSRPLSR